MAFMERIKKAQKAGANSRDQEEDRERNNRNQPSSPAMNTRSQNNRITNPAPVQPVRRRDPSPVYQLNNNSGNSYPSRHSNSSSSSPVVSQYYVQQPAKRVNPAASRSIPNSSQSYPSQSVSYPSSSIPFQASIKSYPVTKQFEQNVFYQNLAQHKVRSLLNCIKIAIIAILAIFTIFCLISALIKPYDRQIPKNGYVRNGVLYCEFGYIKYGDNCVQDADFVEVSNNLAREIVQDLKDQWGRDVCERGVDIIPTPKFKISELSQYIKIQKLNKQSNTSNINFYIDRMEQFFSNQYNQQIYKFKIDNQQIIPLQFQRTLGCRIKNLFISIKFLILLILLIIVASIIYKYFSSETNKTRAKVLYHNAKQTLEKEGRIDFDAWKRKNASDDFGRVPDNVWEKVEGLRAEDKCITRVKGENSVFWKIIK